jgi:hypothetical protein
VRPGRPPDFILKVVQDKHVAQCFYSKPGHSWLCLGR